MECRFTPEQRDDELNAMVTTSNFSQILRLKIGTVVCVANIDLDQQICNGSQGIVTGFSEDGELVPIVQFYNGFLKIVRRKVQNSDYRASWSRRSRLSTRGSPYTNVGATMDIAEIDGAQHIRIRSTYVALSRVKTLNGLYLSGFDVSHHDEPDRQGVLRVVRRQRDRPRSRFRVGTRSVFQNQNQIRS
jgi:ATP-dependent DNA helicase PIF1